MALVHTLVRLGSLSVRQVGDAHRQTSLSFVTLGEKGRRLDKDYVRDLAEDIGCGFALARDLLRLAGDDAQIVRDASQCCSKVESMKAYIIDRRIAKIE